MKKIIWIVAIVVLALGAMNVGAAFAQGGTPPSQPYNGMMGGRVGYSPVHAYLVEAFAAKIDLPVDEVNTRLAAGETIAQIALSKGVVAEDLPAFMADIHKTASAAAVQDGVMTQAQTDFMLQRMAQTGINYGNCSMGGGGYGRSMMGGGRWQTNP